MQQQDIIIIGGGPSGLMAAVAAGESGASVALVDKGDKLGRKLGISGGGRCNVTNAKDLDELIRHIPGNGRFLYSAFSHFSNRDIIAFFEQLGIPLKEEDNGRMFPASDKAKTVVDALIRKVTTLGIEIYTHAPVADVLYEQGHTAGIRLQSGETLRSRCVIIATGGKSVPHTGSTGDGYAWAEAAGHTITELYPTEVPLRSSEPFIRRRELQGLSLRNVALTVWNAKSKKIVEHEGDMLFTHFGLSGPAALRCSQFVIKEQRKNGGKPVRLTIDWFPTQTKEALSAQWQQAWKNEPRKSLRNSLKSWLPDRFVPLLLESVPMDASTTYDHLPKQPWLELLSLVKAFPIQINGTLSLDEAFVTGGGVHLKEVDPKSMGSKLMDGLYFCGEILDVHGYTGGYNITAAFATGYTAGKHAAEHAQQHPLQS